MYYLIVAFVIALIIIIIYRARKEGVENKPFLFDEASLITQFDTIQKNRGNIFDFRRAIGSRDFSPYKYGQLVTLYKQHALTVPNVKMILKKSS